MILDPDLQDSLAKEDRFEANQLKMIDQYIEISGIAAPPPDQVEVFQGARAAPEVQSLDIKQAGIKTIFWATGYCFDFSLVKFSVFDSSGYPINRGGVTQVP